MAQNKQSSADHSKPTHKNGRFAPGHKRFGGRQKGSKNKTTLDIREAMLLAGAELGLDGKGKDGLTGFFRAVGKKKPELLGSWIADLIPRDLKPDENGNAAGRTVMTVNVIGVPSGTFLSREEAHASAWGEPMPLIEHEPAPALVSDDDEPRD